MKRDLCVTNISALRASGYSMGIYGLQTCRPYGPKINSTNNSTTKLSALRASGYAVGIYVLQTCRPYRPII